MRRATASVFIRRLSWSVCSRPNFGEHSLFKCASQLEIANNSDNSCVGCRERELATSRFFSGKFDDVAEVCWPTLIKSSVYHGGDLELNLCLHRQPMKTLIVVQV